MQTRINQQNTPDHGTRLFIITGALVLILYGVYQAQSVVVLFLVSAFLAVIGRVPVLWLERRHVPSLAAVLIVVTLMVTVLVSIGVVVGTSLNSLINALPQYQARMHELLIEFKALVAKKGIVISDQVMLGYVNTAALMNFTAGLFAGLSSLLSSVVLVLLTVTFILLEASGFPAKLRLVHDYPRASFLRFARFANDIKRYMVIKTLLNLIAGTLTAIWLSILGVDFPVLWGFLAFLLHFVPNVGSIVAAIPAVLLALVQLGGDSALLAAAGYLVIGLIVGNIVEPRIMGRRFGMSTLVVFVSLIVWGSLLGLVGALLCVPLTMTLKLACEESPQTRWIAVLLGPDIFPEQIPVVPSRRTRR